LRRPPFHHEDFLVIAGNDAEAKSGIEKALKLLGGKALEMPHGGIPGDVGARDLRGIIASVDALAASAPAYIEALKRRSEEIPLFLFPSQSESGLSRDAVRVLRTLGGPELEITNPAPARMYAFSESKLLWPFQGVHLAEEHDRITSAVAPENRGVEPLIFSEHGCTYFTWRRGSQQVFVSLTSPLEAVPAPRLQDEFRPARFAALLPLMLFARMCLGDAEWRTPRPRATVMIDDPNLRFMRYGFLDYRSLVDAAKDRGLHFTIAMSPIDCKKTRDGVARFMTENRRYVSLVPHGIEHLKYEFDREVTMAKAVATLNDGLRRMRFHHIATGVSFPQAMTFPHGQCNSTWLEAMRRTRFQATFATQAFPIKPATDIHDPLVEMYPAEMTFQGFPMINRFPAEEPKDRLLFEAWLGKPLVVYTHHEFFRDGMGPVLAITDFLDRQVNPTWGDIDFILEENYQWRRAGQTREVRVFSNAVTVAADQGLPVSGVLKPRALDPTQELARINGAEVGAVEHRELGLILHDLAATRDELVVSFEPRPGAETAHPYRTPVRAGMRRLATEIRDHLSAVVTVARQRVAPPTA
jgi:hypothetical protein